MPTIQKSPIKCPEIFNENKHPSYPLLYEEGRRTTLRPLVLEQYIYRKRYLET